MIIWIASYPKSGNTWVRGIVNQLINNDVKKNEDVFDGLLEIRRYPSKVDVIDLPKIPNLYTDKQKKEVIEFTIRNWKKSQEKINEDNEIHILKTHNMLCKLKIDNQNYLFTDNVNSIGVIHVVRDPRNIVSSVKNHFNHQDINESIEMLKYQHTWTGFKNKDVPQLLSSWNNHYNSWKKFPKNNLLIKYENLLQDTKSEIKKMISFLSPFFKINISEEDINKIVKNTSFKNFSDLEKQGKFKENSFDKNKEENKFFFKGPENNWKKILKDKDEKLIISYFKSEMEELNYI